MLVLALINFITTYSLAAPYVYSNETISASKFLDEKAPRVTIIGGCLLPSFNENYSSSCILRGISFHEIFPKPLDSITSTSVIVFDIHNRIWYTVLYGIEKYQYYADECRGELINRIYDNSKYEMMFSGE
jgi:hypothetical protein